MSIYGLTFEVFRHPSGHPQEVEKFKAPHQSKGAGLLEVPGAGVEPAWR